MSISPNGLYVSVRSSQGKQRPLAQGTLQLLVGQLCYFLFGYPVAIILARGLGPESYGVYGFILSILFWVEQVSLFGIPTATAKLIAEDKQRAAVVEGTAFIISLGLLVVTFGLGWFVAPVLARVLHIPEGAALFRLASLDIPFYGMFFFYQGVSRGRQAFGVLSAALTSYALGKLIGVLCLLFLGLSVTGAFLVNIVGSVVGLLFFVSRLGMRFSHWQLDSGAAIMRLALPLAIGLLGESLFHHLDIWNLKAIVLDQHPESIGIYVAASQLARPLPQFGMLAIAMVLLPSISHALANQNIALAQVYIKGAVRFLLVVLLPIAVLVAIQAKDIMTLLFSSRYSTGETVLSVLILGFCLFAFLLTFLTILKARGEILLSAGIVYGLLLLMQLLALVLIPSYGPVGAASALTVTLGVGMLLTGMLVYRRFGPWLRLSVLGKVMLAAALMGIIGTQISASGFWLLPTCAGLLGCYALVLILLGELRQEDLQPLMLWWRSVASRRRIYTTPR
jgi:O-antigen/teichoic acid export membrane protein